MTITQISAVVSSHNLTNIYGLGNDGKVYVWHEHRAEWILYKEES